jgi:hypothetical protein
MLDLFRDNADEIAASVVNASFSCFFQLLVANAIPVLK